VTEISRSKDCWRTNPSPSPLHCISYPQRAHGLLLCFASSQHTCHCVFRVQQQAQAKAAAVKPAAKAQAAAASKPRSALGPATNSGGGGGNGKTIEDIYQKKTQLEHILLRPDTYIGSTEKQQQQVPARSRPSCGPHTSPAK